MTTSANMDINEQVSMLLDVYGVEAIMHALENLKAIQYEPIISTDTPYFYTEVTSNYYN